METPPETESITKKKIVQKDLAMKDAIQQSEETKKFRVYSSNGYALRIAEPALLDLPTKRADMLERENASGETVYTRKQVTAWMKSYVYNRIKGKPFQEPSMAALTELATGLISFIFDDGDLPANITETCIEADYIEFRGQKFKLRVKKKLWENKKAQWIMWFNKESKRSPGKWKAKADDEMRKFIGKKMRLIPSVMASEGEQQGYIDAFVRKFCEVCGTEIPPGQTRLAPVV